MSLESELQTTQVDKKDFLQYIGSSKNWVFYYEEHDPKLPEQFDNPEGLRFLRTGPIPGRTQRHPSEDWISDRPLGPGRTVQLAGVLVYNPKLGEVRIEYVKKIDDYFSQRREFEAQGWQPIPSGLDRVIGYKPTIG